jgi:hypothetical protein
MKKFVDTEILGGHCLTQLRHFVALKNTGTLHRIKTKVTQQNKKKIWIFSGPNIRGLSCLGIQASPWRKFLRQEIKSVPGKNYINKIYLKVYLLLFSRTIFGCDNRVIFFVIA